MAVDARPPHLNHLFPYPLPQLISTRGDFIGERQLYDAMSARMEYGAPPPSASSSKMAHDEVTFPAFYRSAACDDRILSVKSVDSGLTTFDDGVLGAPRKRDRDSVDYASANAPMTHRKTGRLLSVGDRNIALDIHRQQYELDLLITQHIRRMRVEIDEKFKQQSGELLAVIQQGVVRKLSEKDEEIRRAGKLNMALQERVKTLCVENRLLRGMAQTSEAAVNSLRSNLEQVLAVAGAAEDRRICTAAVVVEEDAESCCGSSGGGGATEERQTAGGSGGSLRRRLCRGCREKETCVLLLPCRHLCLCTACGSAVHGCPVCGSAMTGTIHVNMS